MYALGEGGLHRIALVCSTASHRVKHASAPLPLYLTRLKRGAVRQLGAVKASLLRAPPAPVDIIQQHHLPIMEERSRRIRRINDALRIRGGTRFGVTHLSAGIAAVGPAFATRALAAVRRFDAFAPDDDPFGEHEFGTLVVDSVPILFKIDYYDLDLHRHSRDNANPKVTRRVMTVMLAEEY